MSTDRFDEMFTQMMNNLRKVFGRNFFHAFDHQFDDITDDAMKKDSNDDSMGSLEKPTFFGYEILSGSNLKEPMIRMYGNPNDFPIIDESLEHVLSGLGIPGSFKNEEIMIPLDEHTSEDSEITEPYTETYANDGKFVAILDLPGVGADDVRVTVDGKLLTIDARTETRHYKKEIQLGFIPDQSDVHHTMNNGLIEVTIKTRIQ